MRKKLSLPYLGGVLVLILVVIILPLIMNSRVRQIDSVQAVPYSQSEFIKMIAPDVQKVAKSYGVKPSVMIAKAVVDSQSGQTLLSEKYHNLYNLKASGREPFIKLKTSDGQDSFNYRIYKTWKESIYDYFRQIKSGTVGEKNYYVSLISQKNYQAVASVVEAQDGNGSKTYAKELIRIITENNLTEYDK